MRTSRRQGLHVCLLIPVFMGLMTGISLCKEDPFRPLGPITSETKELICPGVTHVIRKTSDPVTIHVFIVSLREPSISVRPCMAHNTAAGLETIFSMIKRTRAMGGVGADYWGADGIPMGLTVIEGDIIIAPKYRTAFAVGKDGVPQIGKWTDGWTWQASVTAPDGTSFPITMMNSECRDNRLCLYTDKYGLPTKGNLNMPASRLSQLRRPVMRSDDSYHPYSESPLTELFLDRTLKASQINTDLQGQSIPRGGTVLAGRGEASNWLRDKFRSGGRARIDLNTKPPWQNLAFAVGGGPQILKDGMNYQDPLEPFPLGEDFPVDWKRLNYLNRKARTAIGVNMNKSTLILVIAELNPPDSIGVYPRQMANVLADFGAWDGMEFNSGPGATLVIDRNVINPVPSNIPNDNTPLVSNALLIYKRQ